LIFPYLNLILPVDWKISGVAVGSGWQALVAYVNLVCYYAIGLPVGCALGFKTDLGVAVSIIKTFISN
jgi:MATE family multidrug resistance protein